MICISVTPASRTLAPADLLNASRHGDLIELCLDHFINEPNPGSLLRTVDKPILVSCRSPKEGGYWKGTEQQRIQLLREAIVAGPEYVELDLEIAGSIPRYGRTKRVISYSTPNRALPKVDEIYERCKQADADVVKFTALAEDLDAAWPLLAAVAGNRDLPIVGMGIGRAGLTFSLLGKKYGSPWVYAALEKGMEAFPEQPTVWQLREDYRTDEIGSKTHFLGIVGRGIGENIAARVLNAAFEEMGRPIRCLPMLPGDLRRFSTMLEKLGINGLVVAPDWSDDLSELSENGDELVQKSGRVDTLMKGSSGSKVKCTTFDAIRASGEELHGSPEWCGRGAVLVLGESRMARGAAWWFASQGAAVSLAGMSDNRAAGVAREAGVRHIPWNSIYDTRVDTLVLADSRMPCGLGRNELNPSVIRERQTIIDLTRGLALSPFAEESRMRGARYLDPLKVFVNQLQIQFRTLTGRDLPPAAFEKGLAAD